MSTIDRLEGVWNIVPTPFLEDGELDEASLPTLTRFVAGCGVDGMTILGVLGEAAKLSDDERGPGDPRRAGGGRRPAGVRRCQPRGDGPGGRLRARGRGARRPLGHARPAGPRPPERRRRAGPLPGRRRRGRRCRSSSRTTRPAAACIMSVELLAAIADRAPTCRVVKLEDEPSPPKVGRLLALRPGPARPGRPRRDHAARGAASRRGRHDDRLRLPGGPRRHRRPLSGRRRGRAPARSSTGSCRSSGSRTSRASTWPSASTSTSVAGRSRRPGCAPRDRRWTRARSPISTWSSRASAWRRRPGPRAAPGSSRRRPGRSPRSRTRRPATAGTPRAGRAPAGRRSGRAGCARSCGA